MALTNNLKPSGFQPVGGGSLLYKWTEGSLSGKTNYRVVVQLNGYTSVLPDYEYRPDASGIIWADIAPLLRSLLALDETTASRMINTYVKYQAVWDESSDAQVNLSSDVIYAYVGNNNSLNYRTKFDVAVGDGDSDPEAATGVFLSYDNLVLAQGKRFYIDFLCDGSLPVGSRLVYKEPDASITNSNAFDGSVKSLQSWDITSNQVGRGQVLVQNTAGTVTYAKLDVEIVEPCNNQIYLRWINDYGGLTHYMFDYNQVYGFQIDANTKAPYYEVGVYGISLDQWKMFNELMREGLIYNDNYKLGQFVEDTNGYGTPGPVIVLPREQATQTKRVGHNIEFIVMYPLIPNNEI